MSDGVDVLFDQDEKAISPGTEGFTDKWAESLNDSPSETMEAYFRTTDYEVIPRFMDFIDESTQAVREVFNVLAPTNMTDDQVENLTQALKELFDQELFKVK